MNKSAIYATVKTMDQLVIPFAAGITSVQIWKNYGAWWGVGAFITLVITAIALSYLGDWILKKLDVPND